MGLTESKDLEVKTVRIGDEVPNFTADSTKGKIDLYEFMDDKWCMLFSHPSDFTPVCTTELGKLQKLLPEFEKRGVKVLSLSCDTAERHEGWVEDIKETQGVDEVSYPIIADPLRILAVSFNMLDQTNKDKAGLPLTVRSVFLIDNKKKIRFIVTYPASTGRNFNELLRCIDSMKLADSHKLATPVDWNNGDDCVILPSVSDADAETLFPKGMKKVKPYLRYTPDPR